MQIEMKNSLFQETEKNMESVSQKTQIIWITGTGKYLI